jgi:hypothetical protein
LEAVPRWIIAFHPLAVRVGPSISVHSTPRPPRASWVLRQRDQFQNSARF